MYHLNIRVYKQLNFQSVVIRIGAIVWAAVAMRKNECGYLSLNFVEHDRFPL